jgi:hypothetical protein
MPEKYEGVLLLLREKGGRLFVDDPDLKVLLGAVHYRLATYIYYIRTKAHLKVRGIRSQEPGRRRQVIAYEIIASASPPPPQVEAPIDPAVIGR